MAKIKGKYHGVITLPDGKKIKFTLEGESQAEVRTIIKKANPKAKVSMKKK